MIRWLGVAIYSLMILVGLIHLTGCIIGIIPGYEIFAGVLLITVGSLLLWDVL